MSTNNKAIFYLTKGTIRTLARELVRDRDLSKHEITPEIVEEVRLVALAQFRNWDIWLKEVILDVTKGRRCNS